MVIRDENLPKASKLQKAAVAKFLAESPEWIAYHAADSMPNADYDLCGKLRLEAKAASRAFGFVRLGRSEKDIRVIPGSALSEI